MNANLDLRLFAKKHSVRLWELAEFLQVSEPTMTRKLRHELSTTEKERCFKAIESISESKTQKQSKFYATQKMA